MFIDTHTHLYDVQFDTDREAVIERALGAGIEKMFLPNCDRSTIEPMMAMQQQWPEYCFPMMGLHPCYVKENYREEIKVAEEWLVKAKFYAIGEIGLDYYWDTTFVQQQKEAFNLQMGWALQFNLPIVIHTRESMADGIEMVRKKQNGNLSGIFHCFGGSAEEAKQITDLGFHLGIGGVATFKKSTLPEVLKSIDLRHIVLETDAPYLAPVPYRGKRNESSYLPLIADVIADAKQCSRALIEKTTTENALKLFKLT